MTREQREAFRRIDEQERDAKQYRYVCRKFGDRKGLRRAVLQLRSIDAARKALRARLRREARTAALVRRMEVLVGQVGQQAAA